VKKAYPVVLFVLLVASLAACGTAQTPTPAFNPPVIDGTLSPGEWDTARVETFREGSQLLLLSNAQYLYLGIRYQYAGMLMGNVFIQRGDRVSILHISAALGTAIYQKGSESWNLIQAFNWQCRDFSDKPEAAAERAAFLEREGWLGSISYAGTPEELEYQILLTDEPLHLLVMFESLELMGLRFIWPSNLEDTFGDLPHGDLPPSMHFSPEQWPEITVDRQGQLEIVVPTPQE